MRQRRLARLSALDYTSLDMAKLRDFAIHYTAAWCSQDPASVAAFYSHDGSLAVNGGAPAVGRNAITDVARSFMSAFPDMQVLMDDLIVKGDRAEYHWTLIGTNTRAGGKGNRVRVSGYEEWTIRSDGLIVVSQGHFDAADYQRQLKHGLEENRCVFPVSLPANQMP
jgi:hypothetical protein